MAHYRVVAVLLIAAVAFNSGCLQEESGDAAVTESPEANSPERVLREFLIAMVENDAETLAQIALPHPNMEVLTSAHEPIPQNERAAIRAQLTQLPIFRLSPGDTVSLPDGRSFEIDGLMVHEDQQWLTFPDNPFPFVLVREQRQWKVNPAPIIAARLAAEEVRQRSSP